MKQQSMIVVVIGILVVAGIGGFLFMNMQNQSPKESVAEKTMVNEEVQEPMNNTKNIVEVAKEAGNFKTLLAAAEAAGLVETLSGDGPLTVFAPTDEAFAKLPAGTVESLLKDKDKLAQILTYHVVAGKVMASDVVNLTSAKTVQGQDIAIKVENGKVMINDANVVTADVEASNGVIHVIDTVILPQ